MTIDEGIERLGDSFRGLWRCAPLEEDGSIGFFAWSVTFLFRGEMVETPDCSMAENALEWAVKKLEAP